MAVVNISYAFEVDGFKDGMSKEMVLEKAKSYNVGKIVENENGLLMLGNLFDDKDIPIWTLSFTDNKLVILQKEFQPSMANYILLFKKLIDKYGSKTYCNAETQLSSVGEIKSIECSWHKDKEEIGISYGVFPINEQLYVRYRAVDKYTPRKVK